MAKINISVLRILRSLLAHVISIMVQLSPKLTSSLNLGIKEISLQIGLDLRSDTIQ